MGRKKEIIIYIILVVLAIVIVGSIFENITNKNGSSLNNTIISESRIASLPASAEILFVSNRDTGSRRMEIYSMTSNGSNQQRLTYTNEHHFIMGIDDSRRYIVTSRAEKDTNKPKGLGDEDRRAVWLIDLDTKKETRLTDIENSAEGDSFSPDGEWIVFCMKIKGEDQMDIYKIKRDGTELTKLTDTKTAIECDPAWSNDGTKIVHTYLDGLDENPRFVLRKTDTNGDNIELVYDGGPGIEVPGVWPSGNYDPEWSPDDKYIIFERVVDYKKNKPENFGSGIGHIFKVRNDGTELVDLSEKGNHADRAEYLASYSPDGKWIVFGSIHEAEKLEDSFSDVFKMDSETGEMTRLTYGPDEKYPIWIKQNVI